VEEVDDASGRRRVSGEDAQPMMSDAARIEELERRLSQLEWRERATERGRYVARMLLPQEARSHLRAAWREQLLAVRSIADHWARSLDEDAAERERPREEIPID
jgi:hypothetical protein